MLYSLRKYHKFQTLTIVLCFITSTSKLNFSYLFPCSTAQPLVPKRYFKTNSVQKKFSECFIFAMFLFMSNGSNNSLCFPHRRPIFSHFHKLSTKIFFKNDFFFLKIHLKNITINKNHAKNCIKSNRYCQGLITKKVKKLVLNFILIDFANAKSKKASCR